jgi:rhamnogalacturonyl hydrolase YesR
MMLKKAIACFLFILQLKYDGHTQNIFSHWPQGSSPGEIGLRVAERFIVSPHGVYAAPGTKPHIPYFEVCTWYGALTFSGLTKNESLKTKLIERFNPLFTSDTSLLPVPDHVDYNVFGTVPIEIYLQTKDKKYFDLGKQYADKQWAAPPAGGPRVTEESFSYYNRGYTWQTRLWIDDMYMITAVQSQAFRATGDISYIERTAKEMVLYLDKLQKPNGLFYHSPDAPFFWGRGNGWMDGRRHDGIAESFTEKKYSLHKNHGRI